MTNLHDRSVPTTLEELVHPRHTALVVVDVQNDFCEKGGVYQKQGRYLSKGDVIIKKFKSIIQAARKVGVQIIYMQQTNLPNHKSDSAAWLRYGMKLWRSDDPNLVHERCLEGSWGHQIIEDIKPRDGDLVVKKNRSSAFVHTNLDMLLRINNVQTLLIGGVVTEGCVLSTARGAQSHDYFVVILRDCVDSVNKDLHNAALKIMEKRLDVVTSDEIIAMWRKTISGTWSASDDKL